MITQKTLDLISLNPVQLNVMKRLANSVSVPWFLLITIVILLELKIVWLLSIIVQFEAY